MANPIFFFSKSESFSWLSDFSPHGFEEDGVHWPTVEHYFQAQKFDDKAYRERIRLSKSPKQAKALGQTRKIKIRDDWESIKEDVMLNALRKKFQSPELRQMLLSTGKRELIENLLTGASKYPKTNGQKMDQRREWAHHDIFEKANI